MEFRLLYEGELPPSANKSRPKGKHSIRRVFHPQLRRLWSVRPILRAYADHAFAQSADSRPKGSVPETPEERFQMGIKAIGHRWSRAGYDIVPIVIPEFALQCSIEILLLRPENYEVFDQWGDTSATKSTRPRGADTVIPSALTGVPLQPIS
jgi:hypothetical protein